MTPHLVLAGLLALAVLLAWARLVRWRRASPAGAGSGAWRMAALIAAQPLCALLLYLTFVPPTVRTAGSLVVATRGAGTLPVLSGAHVVALPEAPTVAGAQRVPDLGTALRRYPGTGRLIVVGEGLPPRDRDAARGRPIDFRPSAAPRGLVHLKPPQPMAPGSAFQISGRTANLGGGSVELFDPAGRRVDRRPLDETGGFALRGTARAPGTALFRLRVNDAGGRHAERASVPVVVSDDPAPRLLLLAGAPGPETKFLRRWAADAGVDMHARLALGGGVEVGDPPIALTRATLDRFDLAILDERSWTALGSGERAALIAGVRGGLGLLVRVTGPVPETTRREWRSLGFAVAGGDEVAALRVSAAEPARPTLTRRTLRVRADDDAPLSPGPGPSALTTWRAEGRGRVALWPVTDTYKLSLGGDAAAFGQLWSETVATLARARAAAAPQFDGLPRVGTRRTICGLPRNASIDAPRDVRTRLVIEGPAACAAFWPAHPGWHLVQPGGTPFYVWPDSELTALRSTEARDETWRLMGLPAAPPSPNADDERPGPAWPWFLAWLLSTAALWWFERAGRAGARTSVEP